MGLRLKYEDIPCGSTTDLRASVLDCVENGTKNLYVIVNYSGLYRTNHMLTELEKTCGKTGAGKAGQEKSAAGKPEPGAQGPEQRAERRGPGMMEQEKMKQDEMQRDGVKQGRMKLVIGHLYPDLLNLYGDRGNIQCFRKRLEWRGMEAEVIPFLSGIRLISQSWTSSSWAGARTGNRNWSADS